MRGDGQEEETGRYGRVEKEKRKEVKKEGKGTRFETRLQMEGSRRMEGGIRVGKKKEKGNKKGKMETL